jgi:hypothetical protein
VPSSHHRRSSGPEPPGTLVEERSVEKLRQAPPVSGESARQNVTHSVELSRMCSCWARTTLP